MVKKNYRYKTTEECKDAVIFARVSSERQEQGASIDAQLATIDAYCKEKGLNIIKKFIITESTMRGDRKQYKEMLSFVQNRKLKTAIVVNCVDRLQRSYKDTPALDELRKQGKVEVHFLKEKLILHKDSKGMDILFWNMCVLMANSYVLTLSDNVRRSLEFNWAMGKWQGRAPIGYLNIRDESGHADIVIDEEFAPMVKRLFEEYATGNHSIKSLWILAKNMGLYSKSSKKRKQICRNKIYDILREPFYYGMMCIKNQEIPHCYKPIISKELFDKVQEILYNKGQQIFCCHQQKYGAIAFTFRGLIKCGHCGCSITPEMHKKKNGKEYVYLRCSHLKGECNQSLVNEKIILDQLETEVFSKLNISPRMLELLKSCVLKYFDEEASLNNKIKKNLSTQKEKLDKMENNLLDMRLNESISEANYNRKMAEIQEERKELERSAGNFIDISADLKEAALEVLDIAGTASYIMKTAQPQQKNELLKILFENMTLEDKTLRYTIREPFNTLIRQGNIQNWLNTKPETLNQLQNLSADVKRFKEEVIVSHPNIQ